MNTNTNHLELLKIHARAVTGLNVRALALRDIDNQFLEKWDSLVECSSNPNPFIAPQFIIPAAQHLRSAEPVLIVIEKQDRCVGLGVFEQSAGSRRMPMPHLRAWQTPHSFQAGMLFEKSIVEPVAAAFWHYMITGPHNWHAVEFPLLRCDDPTSRLFIQAAQAAGTEAWIGPSMQRATLGIDSNLNQRTLSNVSTRRARSLRRGWNALTKHGDVQFGIRHQKHEIPDAIENLLTLEAMGWKGDCQTALASDTDHTNFFRQMVTEFARKDAVFFTELSINDQPVASVVHLITGRRAAAFKLGWDPQFERGCPGYQIKAQLIKEIHQLAKSPTLSAVETIDSCASPGSFIEHIWPDRQTFATHLFMTSRAGLVAGSVIGGLRWLRNQTKSLFKAGWSAKLLAETESEKGS